MAFTTTQMKCWIVVVAALLQLATADDAQVTQLGRSVGQFGTDLYQVLAAQDGGFVFSPLSIHTALSLVWMGAGGNSEAQLRSGLRYPASQEDILTGVQGLLSAVQVNTSTTVAVANRMYVEQSYSINSTYLEKGRTYFRSGIESVDFVNNPDDVAAGANQWVEMNTAGFIKELFAPGVVTSDARLLLVNAVYFKSLWDQPFDEYDTYEELFHQDLTNSKAVSMMHVGAEFAYSEREDLMCQILTMFFKDNAWSFTVLLPSDTVGLSQLEERLHGLDFERIFPTDKQFIDVTLPRFKLESKFNLPDDLKKLNITDIFSPGFSDLSGISTEDQLFVSQVVHKVYINVTEIGTEAAAATGVVANTESLKVSFGRRFVADHPFLFVLYHHPSRTPLFLGRYTGPP